MQMTASTPEAMTLISPHKTAARRVAGRLLAASVLAGSMLVGGCTIGDENGASNADGTDSAGPAATSDPADHAGKGGAGETSASTASDAGTGSADKSFEPDKDGFGAVSGEKDSYIVPDESPLPPGTALDISPEEPTPGEYFNFQVCSAAYSFSLPDGRKYAVTASHCGKEGDTVWAGQENRKFKYPAEPIGHVVYSDLYAGESHDLDVALIELTGDAEYYTPSYSDTAVAESLRKLPDEVCKLGRSTDITCGKVTGDKEKGTLNTKEEKLESTSARAHMCAKTGDSGGPVYTDVDGMRVIVGIVSGTTEKLGDDEECTADRDIGLSFTPIVDVQRVIEDQLGETAGHLVENEAA